MIENAGESPPLSVHVFATSRCNLSCKHCYIEAAFDATPIYELQGDLIIRTIHELAAVTPFIDFELEGGEILLHPQFTQIINGINEELLPKVTVTTNAVIPFPFDTTRITGRSGPMRLRVSAEGHTEKAHNLLRTNCLTDVLRYVEQGAQHGANMVIRATLHSGNVQHIKEMITTFAATGANELQFLEFQACGRGSRAENHWLIPEDMWIESALQEFATHDIPNGIQRMSLSLSKRRIAQLERLAPVLAREDLKKISRNEGSITVNWDGSLGCCPWQPFETVISPQRPDDLTSYIFRMLKNGELSHDCDFCSAVTIIRNCCDE